jgi:uncharacterized membrane protein
MAVLFAVITALTYGGDFFFVRKGLLKTPNPTLAAFLTLTINFFCFILLTWMFVPLRVLRPSLVYSFIIAGLLAPGLARVFSYNGVKRLGMSITAPIVNAESLFSVALAILFLNEPLNTRVGVGVLSVVMGLAFLGYESGQKNPQDRSKEVRLRYFLFPILASVFYAVSMFFRKAGLNALAVPIVGATVTSGTSWVVTLVFLIATGNWHGLFAVKKESLGFFAVAGAMTSLGWCALFYALQLGTVSVVIPIATSYSLVTLLLSVLLLRQVERVTWKVVLATVLVVAGVVTLSLAK